MDPTDLTTPNVVISNPCSTCCGLGCGCPNDRLPKPAEPASWQLVPLGRYGWICAKCGCSNSPDSMQCPSCPAPTLTGTTITLRGIT